LDVIGSSRSKAFPQKKRYISIENLDSQTTPKIGHSSPWV